MDGHRLAPKNASVLKKNLQRAPGRWSGHRKWIQETQASETPSSEFHFRVPSNLPLENSLSEILVQKLWGKKLLLDDSLTDG